MLNATYKHRRTNIWVRERTKVIDLISNDVRKMKWSYTGHIHSLKEDRWTSRATSLRPHDNKILPGRPAKWRRDDLAQYWRDTIWQRTEVACRGLTLRWHAEAFGQQWNTTASQSYDELTCWYPVCVTSFLNAPQTLRCCQIIFGKPF